MAVSIGDIIGTIELEDTFSPKLELAARNVEAFAGKMDRIGSRIENVGRKLTLSLTLPIAAVTGAAVKSATTLNETLANVSALLTDVSGAELDQTVNSMRGKIQGLAHDMGKSTKDIGEGLYEVISSLGNTNDTFGQLEISSKAASAGLATTQESFKLLSAVTKVYGDTSEAAFKKVADLSFQAVNVGQTTFPELAASIGGVAPIAQYAGVALEELFAVIATATGVSGNTSEVTTQMASAISALLDPSKELNNLYKEQSIASSQAAIAEMGLVGTLQMIVDHANATGKPLADLLGRKEAVLLAATLAGEQEQKFAQDLALMGEAATANGRIVGDAFDKQTQGVNKAGFAWKQFQAEVQIALENLGDKLIPIITNAAEQLRPLWEATLRLLDTFGKLPQSTQTIIVSLVGLAALTGPVMMLFGGMLKGISALLPVVPRLTASYTALNASLLAIQAGYGKLVLLNVAQVFRSWSVAALGVVTSFTAIGTAIIGILLLLNRYITRMKEAMQLDIEKMVTDVNRIGQSLDRLREVRESGGVVSGAKLQELSDELTGISDQIDSVRSRQVAAIDQVTKKYDEEIDRVERLAGKQTIQSEQLRRSKEKEIEKAKEADRTELQGLEGRKKTIIQALGAVTQVIEKEGEAAEEAAVAVNSLSEQQASALNSLQQRIAALAREDAAQRALLAALKESPEAYKAERREQEINNAVLEIRQQLLESQLTLTPALEARIRSLTGSIFDSKEVAEAYNRILAAVERAQNTVLEPLPDSDPWGVFADNGILDAFNKSLADEQAVLEEITGQHNRQARAIRAVNALLANGLITEEQRNEYMRQFSDMWEALPAEITIAEQLLSDMVNTLAGAGEAVSTALADGLVEAAFEGGEAWDDLAGQLESIFRRLIADWLSQWIRAMAQWLAKWIATQAKAKAAQAALGTGGGGGIDAGTVAGIGSNLGGGTGTYAGGGGAAAAGGGTSALVAGGATLAIFAAIYIGVSAWIRSHKEHAGQVTFQLAKESGAAVNDIKGSLNKVNGLTDSVKAAGKAVNDWLEELGGALEGMSEKITIGSSGQGKGTRHFVIDEGVKKWFATYEQALEFAILEALKTSDVSGFSQLMKEGLATGASESLDELKDLMTSLREVSDLNLSPAVVQAREAAIRFNELWQVLTDLPAATSAVIEGFSSLIVSEAMMWQNLFNSLTGKQLSESEIRAQKEKQLELATIEFNIRKAQIQQRIYQIGVEILALKASNAFTNGIGGDRNNGRGGGLVGVAYAFAMAGSVISQTAVMVETSVNGLSQSVLDMIAALEAEAAALAKLLEALPTPPSPGDIQPSGGRGGGSGPSSADLRTDLRSEIARMVAEAEGELHALVFDFDQAIADITERAKEAKLPAEELAAAIALMTQKLQEEIRTRAEALAGIGTDFTRRLRDTIDFFREIRELGRKKTGMPDWLVDLLEGKALAKLGTEINGAIATFNGMTDPMLAIQMQADELRENFLAWAEAAGLSAEEIAQGTAAIESGREFQRQSAITGILDTVFGYLKDAPQYAGQLVEFEKMKIDLQFRLIEAQLRALGAWDATTEQMVNDARQIANDLAEGGRELDRSVARFRGYNDDESDPWRRVQDFVKDQTQAFRAGIKGLIDSTQDLFTDDELTNLTQEEQMAAARARVMDLIAKAEGGDVEALGDLAAARAEFLSELRESEGAGFGFDQGWDEIMGRTADLLANAQDIEADVVAKAWEDAIANDDENTEDITEAIYDSARILAQEIRDAINGVPALAAGGIVMSGPRLVRVAEHSPEAIVPLDRLMSAIPYTYQEPSDKIEPPTLPATPTVSVYDQSERFRQFQRQNDSANRLSKIEESNRAMAMTMARMQQDMSALRRKMM